MNKATMRTVKRLIAWTLTLAMMFTGIYQAPVIASSNLVTDGGFENTATTPTKPAEPNKPSESTGAALVLNGSFENVTTGEKDWQDPGAANWKVWIPVGAFKPTVDTTVATDGSKALKIHVPAGQSGRIDVLQSITLEGGKRYTLTGKIKLKDIQSRQGVYIRTQYLKDGKKLSVNGNGPATKKYGNSSDPNKTYDWTDINLDLNVPAEANGVKIELFYETGSGTAWFDQIAVTDYKEPPKPPTPPTPTPQTIVTNGSFEKVTTGQKDWQDPAAEGWKVWIPVGAFKPTVDTTVATDGSKALKIHVPAGQSGRIDVLQSITLEGGKRYTLTGKIKLKDIQSQQGVYVRTQYLKDGKKLSVNGNGPATKKYGSSSDPNKTYDWTDINLDLNVPAEANGVKIELFYETGSGTAWFDQIAVTDYKEPPKPPTPPTPTPQTIVTNGSFEKVTTGQKDWQDPAAEGWKVWIPVGAFKPTVDTTVATDGSKALKIHVPAGQSGRIDVLQSVTLEGGKRYTLTGKIKLKDIQSQQGVYVRTQYLKDGKKLSVNGNGPATKKYGNSSDPNKTYDWTDINLDLNVPAEANGVKIELFYETGSGTAWFDQIAVADYKEPPKPTTLVANGSFEKVTTGEKDWQDPAAEGWKVWIPVGAFKPTVDTTVAADGNNALKIHVPAGQTGRIDVLQTVPVEGGKRYALTGMMKLKDITSNVGVYMRTQYLKDGKKLSLGGNGPVTGQYKGTQDWTPLALDVKVPAEANGMKMELFYETGSGTAWFDKIAMKDMGKYATAITLDQANLVINKGKTAKLTHTLTPADAAETVVWTSSDTTLATVNDGVVTANTTKSGTVIITAKAQESGLTALCKVYVGRQGDFTVDNITLSGLEDEKLVGKVEPKSDKQHSYRYELLTKPSHGVAHLMADGSFTYYGDRNYVGADTMTIRVIDEQDGVKESTVTIDVKAVNDPFVFVDKWYMGQQDAPISGKVQVMDPDADSITYTLKTQTSNGTVNLQSDGNFVYTPNAGYTGYDVFMVTATDGKGYTADREVTTFAVPSPATLEGLVPANTHPRLMVKGDKIAQIRTLMETDDYVKGSVAAMVKHVDKVLSTPPTPESKKNPYVLRARVIDAAILYQLTKDTKYSDHVWKELESVAAYKEWGLTNSMLAAAETTYSVAFSYDMIYDTLTDAQRAIVVSAIREKALKPYLGVKYGERGNNINYVVNGNMAFGALAIMDREVAPSGEQKIAGTVLSKALNDLQMALPYYTKDGAWPEGPMYWVYGGQYLTYFTIAAANSMNTDFGLSDIEGFKNSGAFPVFLNGPGGPFNFADGGGGSVHRAESMWFAKRYNTPSYAHILKDEYERNGNYSGMSVLFYEPRLLTEEPKTLDKIFTGVETSTFRSNWGDDQALYGAIKGVNTQMLSHSDLDSGTFVLDALGVRWAMDLGTENYGLPGFWHPAQRFKYYRKKTEGHNTLVVNPLKNPVFQQDANFPSVIETFVSKPRGGYSITDMTKQYQDAVSLKRGFKLFNDRSQFMVQDEMHFKAPSTVYWFMHTSTDIELVEGGKGAVLRQGGKKLYLKIASDVPGAVFTVMDPKPLPGLPHPHPEMQIPNVGIKKLAVKMDNVLTGNIAVWMVPLLESQALPTAAPTLTPLSSWSIPEGAIEKAELTDLKVNGTTVKGFSPDKTTYDVMLPYGTTNIPVISASSNLAMTITQATKVDGAAFVEVKTSSGKTVVYGVNFKVMPLIGAPTGYEKITVNPALITATAVDGINVPANTVDGDMLSRWSAKGLQSITFDLGAVKPLTHLAISFFSGDKRSTIFDLEVSDDGVQYRKVLSRYRSSGVTIDFETIQLPSTSGRFVRIVGYGNTSSTWNSIQEVAFYGAKIPTPSPAPSGGSSQSSGSSSSSSDSSVDIQDEALPEAAGDSVTDIKNHWAMDSIKAMVNAKIMFADPETSKFQPDGEMTRSDFVRSVALLMKLDTTDTTMNFEDVAKDSPFVGYINAAQKSKIIFGVGDKKFNPEGAVTREEMAVILMRIYDAMMDKGDEKTKADLSNFKDAEVLSDWSEMAMSRAVGLGLIQGVSADELSPKTTVTKGQLATLLLRVQKMVNGDTAKADA